MVKLTVRWWVVGFLAIAGLVVILLAPPTDARGDSCGDSTAAILLSPGFQDAEVGGTSCAEAARSQGVWGAGIAVIVVVGAVLAERRRRQRVAAAGGADRPWPFR